MAATLAPRRILIAIDDSSHAKKAVEFYAKRIHREGNKVMLCRVIGMSKLSGAQSPMTQMMSEVKIEVDKTKKFEQTYVELLEKLGVPGAEVRVAKGQLGTSVVKVAEKEKVNLVLIGNSGDQLLSGSDSEMVVHHSPCPVIVCK